MTMTQQEVGEFVNRNVIYNLSPLFGELSNEELAFRELDESEFFSLFSVPGDPEDAARDEGWEKYTCGPDHVFVNSFEEEVVFDVETWQELCESQDIEVPSREVMEHWLVNRWFAKRLEARGEHIVWGLLGFEAIWCRTTSGQAILLDEVVIEIANTQNDEPRL